MSSPDLKLLALFSEREVYEKYKGLILKEGVVLSETGRILSDYEAYYRTNPGQSEIDFDQFKTFIWAIRHADWKSSKLDAYDAVLEAVKTVKASKPDKGILEHFQRKDACNKIVEIANNVADGTSTDLSPIITIVEETRRHAVIADNIDALFGPNDLSKVLESRLRTGGLEWRLDSFNTTAGPLHSGDFVLLMGRPESGKTSFLCDNVAHFTTQLPEAKDTVIFNPEEGGGRVFLRTLTAALNEDILALASDEARAEAAYEALMGRKDRIKIVEPGGGISTQDIERVLDKGNYGLVAINVVDKLKLPRVYGRNRSDEKEVERYRSLAFWLREAANRYNVPILTVAQADNAAEGQRWLTQSMIYGSKTGVQGEVDLLIGMGHDRTVPNRRFFSLLKNKLPGGPKTIATRKHAQFETEFSEATGRFSDVA